MGEQCLHKNPGAECHGNDRIKHSQMNGKSKLIQKQFVKKSPKMRKNSYSKKFNVLVRPVDSE